MRNDWHPCRDLHPVCRVESTIAYYITDRDVGKWRSTEGLHPILALGGTVRLAGDPGSLVRLELHWEIGSRGRICTRNSPVLSRMPLLLGHATIEKWLIRRELSAVAALRSRFAYA